MSKARYLLDVNMLIALTQEEHPHHNMATRWLATPGLDWGMCAFSEAGFLRVTTNPRVGKLTMEEAQAILASLANHPGYRFWPITEGWTALTTPFSQRIFGHQQVTDAFLLGLAVKQNGILVTMDKTIAFLAGAECSRNVLVLPSP